jgi:FkbM family methyltransferase
MNPLFRFLDRSIEAFCGAPMWRRECRVWDQRMVSATFDRWLYLRLHKFGHMGGTERAALHRLVHPGMTVVDVGSNLGLYTVLLSRLVGPAGRVLAFEPDPDLFALLQRNGALNGCHNVASHNLALGSRRDRLLLHKMIVNSGDNHLGEGGSKLFRRTVETEVVSLDEFTPDLQPDFVKIDVQGWELPVLRGMARLLKQHPPAGIYLEFWPEGFRRAGYAADDVVAFLTGLGFHFHRADTLEALDPAALGAIAHRLTGLKHVDLYATRQPLPEQPGESGSDKCG